MKRDLTALALDAVSAYRLTRLVTKDSLLVNVRDRIVESAYERSGVIPILPKPVEPGDIATHAEGDPNAPKLATLITCRWCSGAWIAAAVVALRAFYPRQWEWMARTLTIASAAALIAGLEK